MLINTESLDLGVVPYDESPIPYPYKNPTAARAEATRYRDMLRNLFQFAEGPHAFAFRVVSNPYENSFYYSVAIFYDVDDELAHSFAFFVEAHTPETWECTAQDVEALKQAWVDWQQENDE